MQPDLDAIRAVAKRVEVIGRATIIYALCEADFTPRYVGKTVQRLRCRVDRHFHASRRKRLPVERWVAKRGRSGIRAVEIETVPPGCDWAARERFWIARFRDDGAPLLNLTDGGEGQLGRKKSADEIAKITAHHITGRHKTCLCCEALFWTTPREERKGNGKYCSRRCYQIHGNTKSKPVSRAAIEASRIASRRRFASQTHCKRGHPLSGGNLYLNSKGARVCKECRTLHKQNHRARHNAE